MPLASQERVEGVSRFGRDSVAIRSRFGRNRSRFGRNRSRRFGQLMPKARRKDGKMSRKTVLESVVKNGAGDNSTEGKVQRRQNVAKNGIDLGAWRGVGRDSVAIGPDSVAIRSRFGRVDSVS